MHGRGAGDPQHPRRRGTWTPAATWRRTSPPTARGRTLRRRGRSWRRWPACGRCTWSAPPAEAPRSGVASTVLAQAQVVLPLAGADRRRRRNARRLSKQLAEAEAEVGRAGGQAGERVVPREGAGGGRRQGGGEAGGGAGARGGAAAAAGGAGVTGSRSPNASADRLWGDQQAEAVLQRTTEVAGSSLRHSGRSVEAWLGASQPRHSAVWHRLRRRADVPLTINQAKRFVY